MNESQQRLMSHNPSNIHELNWALIKEVQKELYSGEASNDVTVQIIRLLHIARDKLARFGRYRGL
jgi:hypothetical protein